MRVPVLSAISRRIRDATGNTEVGDRVTKASKCGVVLAGELLMIRSKPSVGRNVGAMVAASCTSAITGVILMFWIPRLLSVDDFGYWRTFLLYSGYAGFLHLGLVDGALLHWSQSLEKPVGASLFQAAKALLLEHLVIGVLGLAFFLSPLAGRPHFCTILCGLFGYALTFNLVGLAQVRLQAYNRFATVAVGMAGPGVLFVCAVAALHIRPLTLGKLVLAYLVAWAFTAALLWTLAQRAEEAQKQKCAGGTSSHSGRAALALSVDHVRAGWPIMLASTGYGVMQSADRITVNLSRPIHDFAIYSLSQSTIYVPIAIIIAVSRVAFSHFAVVGEEGRAGAYRGTVRVLTLLWSLLLPYFFVVEWVVQYFLPKYTPGLPAGRILLLSVLFLSLISIVQANTYALAGRQRQFFAGSLGAVALAFATAWIGSRWLNSLAAVAWSQVLSAAIWWLGNEWAMRRERLFPTREILRVLVTFFLSTGGLYLAASWSKEVLMKISLYCLLLILPVTVLYWSLLRDGAVAFQSLFRRPVTQR